MGNSPFWAVLWVACGLATVVAAVLARRSGWARTMGRVATGVLFLVGGALVHVVNLATGVGYADFADPAHFGWVTDTWRSVVGPNQGLFIGLLIVFEATVGLLTLMGGRWTVFGYVGVIGFYAALWIFGWFETVWVLIMMPAVGLLLWAERHAEEATPTRHVAAHAHA